MADGAARRTRARSETAGVILLLFKLAVVVVLLVVVAGGAGGMGLQRGDDNLLETEGGEGRGGALLWRALGLDQDGFNRSMMEGQSNGHHEGATETIPTTRPPVGAHVLGTLQPASQRPAFGTPRLTSGNVRAPASIYDCEEGRRGEGGGVALTISGAAVLWLVGRLSR